MRKSLLILCCVSLLLFTAGCDSTEKEERKEAQTEIALAALDAWLAGDVDAASVAFSDEMKEHATPEKLSKIKEGMLEQFGSFEERTETQWEDQSGDCAIVNVTCRFTRYWVDIEIAVNQDNQIVAMNLDPGKAVK